MALTGYSGTWRRPPPESVGVDWGAAFAQDALAVFDGRYVRTPNRIIVPEYLTATFGASEAGPCAVISGGSDSVARYNVGTTLAGSDPCSVEFIAYGTAFPSLSTFLTFSPESRSDGAVNRNVNELGAMRGPLAFTGGPPCDIYAWGGNNDYDSNVQFQTSTRQHVLITKASGTGAVQFTVYVNGAQVAQGNGSNGSAFTTSGPYLYVGGRHEGGANSATVSIAGGGIYRRVIGAAEAAERFRNYFALFSPRRIWVPVTAATDLPTLSASTYKPSTLSASGWTARITAS